MRTRLSIFSLIIALCASCVAAWSHSALKDLESEACSRSKSREARGIVNSIIELSAAQGVDMADCPLSPEKDIYLEHERDGKRQLYRSHWMCTYSGKTFKTEDYVDLHLHRHWQSKIDSSRTVCLAEMCDVLKCPSAISGGAMQDRSHNAAIDFKCSAILHKCFPARAGAGHRTMYSRLHRLLCSKGAKGLGEESISSRGGGSDVSIRVVFGIITAVVVAVFYILSCLHFGGSSTSADSTLSRLQKKAKAKSRARNATSSSMFSALGFPALEKKQD